MTVPVVLLIFRRHSNLGKLIKAVSKYQPSQLFIIADGPRNHAEKKQTDKARSKIMALITWPCQLHTNFAPHNLGLKVRFQTGIDWVFKHTDRAIFLEDDCLPEPSFFLFCEQLLLKYQNDPRVMTISGNNFQFRNDSTHASYYFSRYPHIWGWATWKRVWDQYDSNIRDWPTLRQSDLLDKLFPHNFFIRKFWKYIFDRLYADKINTWDYQLSYLSFKNDGLNIIPSVNLVTNVGYGSEATNLKHKNRTIGVPTHPLSHPLKHPHHNTVNVEADNHISELVYLNFLGKISLLIKSLFGLL